jgi:hypothetical protein
MRWVQLPRGSCVGVGQPEQGSRAAVKLASVSTLSFESHQDYDQLETFKPISISISPTEFLQLVECNVQDLGRSGGCTQSQELL